MLSLPIILTLGDDDDLLMEPVPELSELRRDHQHLSNIDIQSEMVIPLEKVTGDRVEIRGLCSFYVKQYKTYSGRNPKTGEKVKIASKKLPFFKVGKDLKEKVNTG